MVNFVRRRLQVFVSSTYTDLKLERQAAVEAILVAGHIPAGMELFIAGDETQMDVIKQWIDESDVYMLILGGRYGSVEKNSGKSYTQLEYEYAASIGKPMFACVINESAVAERVKKGIEFVEMDEPKKLREFRELVKGKMVRFWDDQKDIKITTGEALSHFDRNEELVGWVRPTTQADMPALLDEIARLSKENAQLRSQIDISSSDVKIQGLSFEDLKLLVSSKNLLEFLYDKRHRFSSSEGLIGEIDKCRELVIMGLLKEGSVYNGSFVLTEAGRMFINKLEVMKAKENSGDGAKVDRLSK